MVITSTGNVGIGTEFPTTKFEVMGNITKLRTNGETQVSLQQDAAANGQIVINKICIQLKLQNTLIFMYCECL